MARTIQGTIYDPFNAPLPDVLVQAFDRDLRTEELLGEARTDAQGKYAITYKEESFEEAEGKKSADIFLRIAIRLTDTVQQEIARSPIHFNVPEDYVLDFKIDGTPNVGASEFDTLLAAIAPLLTRQQGVEIHDLKADEAFNDFLFLSMETGIDAALIALLPIAYQHHLKTKDSLPPENDLLPEGYISQDIYYALLRLQFPAKFQDLLRVQEQSLRKGIEEAIAKNIISARWREKISGILAQFNRLSTQFIMEGADTENVAFRKMLGATIDKKKQQETFIETYYATEAQPEQFWAILAEQPGFTDGTIIKETQKVLRLNLLTNQPVLAARLYKLQETDPSLQETRDYAKLTKADFAGHISSLVENETFGDFPAGIEGATPEEKTENYAIFLEGLVRELFPTDVFKFRLLADQADPFGPAKADLATFLAQNPEMDIATTKIDAELAQADFSGINDRCRLAQTVKQVNRVAKLSTRYDYARSLLGAGLDSAAAIASLSKKDFMEKAQGAIPETEAEKIYRKAVRIDQRATALAVRYRTANDTAVYALNGGTVATASNSSIFGDVNLCDCAHCQSVYSPAAYLVDMLGTMRKRERNAFDELVRRRADITHIQLTCKNTNTVLPYIDLVNEVLENQVANNGAVDAATVPQTTLAAKELAAFPEHENPAAYEKLADDFSAPQLPFNLPLDKARIFLDKLKNPRHTLMELFFGGKAAEKYNDIPIATEYLQWSAEELMYISADPALPDINIVEARINEVAYYLELTGLTYAELQQVLKSEVVANTGLGIEINDTDNNAATCDLDLLRFEGMDSAILKKHLRLVRLWKKLAWSFEDLDTFFALFNTVDFDSVPNSFNQNIILPLSHTLRLQAAFKWSIPQIIALWSGEPAATISAFSISESEFELYNQAPELAGIPGLNNEDKFYRYTIWANKLGVTTEALWQLITLTGITPFPNLNTTSDTLKFVDLAALIQRSPFPIAELFQLLRPNEGVLPEVDALAVTGFFDALQAELQTVDQQFPTPAEQLAAQEKLIADALGVAFKVEPAIASFFMADHAPLPWFTVNEQREFSWLLPDLANSFRVLKATFTRLAVLRDKLSIRLEEVQFFQKNEAAFQLSGIWHLPTDNTSAGQYPAFENLLYLLQFRDSLGAPAADWFTLFNPLLENAADAKNRFVDDLASLSNFEKASIEPLVGIGANTGALKFTFPDDFLNGKNLLNILACLKKAAQLGTTPEDLSELIKPKASHADAAIAEKIWKAKYNENDWLEAMQEINKPLREKKRNALAGYLLHAPESAPFRADNNITGANDLYAHFLMDVEMSACMMTSRIKQAISSVQLFIDRCLMGLEAGELGQIRIAEGFATHWNQWRKAYRVWEANRKVFLYPENWIEPELRKDKSPFFKELESKLTQNDVTDEIAKDALLEYLEKLDTVANLEIIAFFPDESTKITHVVGRTKTIPHQYFYRKHENSIWTAWEPVELDIQGDHVLLVVWNNRLMVFWGEFAEKQDSSNTELSLKLETTDLNKGGTIKSGGTPEMDWEMKLNWSEYKNGKWGAKKVSKESSKIKRDSANFRYEKNQIFLSSLISNGGLFIRLIAPDTPNLVPSSYAVKNDKNLDIFYFDNCNSSPSIVSIADSIEGINTLSLRGITGTKIDSMFLVEGDTDSFSIYKSGLFMPYPIENSNEIKLLGNTPGKFQILANHHEIERVHPAKFFYHNEQSVFYVVAYRVIDRAGDKDDTVIVHGALATRAATEPATISPFTNVSGSPFTQSVAPVFVDSSTVPPPAPESQPNPQPHHPVTFRNKYQFTTFYHPFVCEYIEMLNTKGIDSLYTQDVQKKPTTVLFNEDQYDPNTANVGKPYPVEKLDFSTSGAYSLYNWELFFHIPFLMATRLNQNQKFDEARKWFHYIFDPTMPAAGDTTVKRFWIPQPFKKEIEQSVLSIEELINDDDNLAELNLQLKHWENNPFQPHVVANFRPTAYMRATFMKYIDNLIDWGDQLFRRDSLESLNEATLLYVLAANLLGKKQPVISALEQPAPTTFDAIQDRLNPFNNAKVAIESYLSPDELEEGTSLQDIVSMPLFCLPKNDELLKYWDTVADRLFKIRHCQNIEGVFRQLPLFQPPIDPGQLVRAANAGLDLNDILNDIQIATPHYRFQVMLQKANEFCNDVKSLGSQFLSTYEKRDAEELALIRSGQEIKLLELMKDIKKRQIDEAKENIKSLEATRKVTEERMNYYGSREFMNESESAYYLLTQSANAIQATLHLNYTLASLKHLIPDTKIGSGFTLGTTYGGLNLGNAAITALEGGQALASFLRTGGEMANILGTYQRRADDWQFQTKTAELELKQIDKQLIAAQIRLAIAEKDLSNHEVQIEQSQKVEDYLRSKFTNAELYNYMVKQLSSLFFQSYQLAYGLAKKAERCFQLELGIESSNYIKFGHWDSLKKGLLSGEHLQLDLRRLELAYLEQNERDFELTKHISLRQLNPLALLRLKATGTCDIKIPEMLLDMDCPGHYMRRIKAVSLSIPAIAGPYTSVNCTLSLQKSSIRKSSEATEENYVRENGSEDPRFIDYLGATSSIVTSNAQNDSGLFEVNFRDERFLPFENAGAISSWKLELPDAHRQFDYNTITDVILHLRYTAKNGGTALKDAAALNVADLLKAVEGEKLYRLFSLQHDFPVEWHQFVTDGAAGNFKAVIKKEAFSFLSQGKEFADLKVSVQRIGGTGDFPENPVISNLGNLQGQLNLNSQGEIELDRAILGGGGHVFMILEYGFE